MIIMREKSQETEVVSEVRDGGGVCENCIQEVTFWKRQKETWPQGIENGEEDSG